MNKIKQFASHVNANKTQIIVRTVVIAGAVVGVTLASGLIKVAPTDKLADGAEKVAKAVKKAAE